MMIKDDKSLDQLVAYIFHELPQDEEAALEQRLDADPAAAEIMDELLDYCTQHQLTTRQALEADLHAQQQLLQAQRIISPKPAPPAPTPVPPAKVVSLSRRTWVSIAAGVALLLLVYLVWQYLLPPASNQLTEQPQLPVTPLIEQFWEAEADKFVHAGTTRENWQKAFLDRNFLNALTILQEKAAKQPLSNEETYLLCVLYGTLPSPHGDRAQAEALLKRLAGTAYASEAKKYLYPPK